MLRANLPGAVARAPSRAPASKTEEILFDIDKGWQQLGVDTDAEGGDAASRLHRVGGIELPASLIKMVEDEARRDEEADARAARRNAKKTKRATWSSLRIVGGRASGVRLLSPKDRMTRPMMEKVRIAVFNMLQSLLCCSSGELPRGARWLDLYAGTVRTSARVR